MSGVSASEVIQNSFEEAKLLLEEYVGSSENREAQVRLADKLAKTFADGGKVLIAGNGGSMSDAIHFAEEWTGRFRADRRPYPAMALADASHLTCIANDYGFDHVFSRMVEAFGKSGDVLILLTTSGKSKNLLLAAEAGRAAGCHVFGFLGRGGGPLLELCDDSVMAPGTTSDRIQELHMMSLHILIETVEVLLDH